MKQLWNSGLREWCLSVIALLLGLLVLWLLVTVWQRQVVTFYGPGKDALLLSLAAVGSFVLFAVANLVMLWRRARND